MDDLLEKVISALQGEVDSAAYMGHSFKDCVPVRHLLDALSLLKEQAEKPMKIISIKNNIHYLCGNCGERFFTVIGFKKPLTQNLYQYIPRKCPKCGKAVNGDE